MSGDLRKLQPKSSEIEFETYHGWLMHICLYQLGQKRINNLKEVPRWVHEGKHRCWRSQEPDPEYPRTAPLRSRTPSLLKLGFLIDIRQTTWNHTVVFASYDHVVCSLCRSVVTTCGVCSIPYPETPIICLVAAKLAAEIRVPCRNEDKGCTVQLTVGS